MVERMGVLLLILMAAGVSKAEKKQITLTQGQFCKSCSATVEALFEYTEAQSKENRKLDLNGDTVATEMCSSPPFIYYKDFFRIGCEQIAIHNLTKLAKPLMNQDFKDVSGGSGRTTTGNGVSTVFKSDTLKFEHTKQFCAEIGACPDTFFDIGRDTIKEKCQACREFVWDFKVVLAREKEVTPRRVLDVLTSICEKLALLHLRPGKLEDACEEFVEVWYEKYLEEGDDEEFIHRVADNIDEIMVGRYDITSPMCSEYTKACSPEKKKRKKKKKKTKKKKQKVKSEL